jgi:hypothetical protein
MLGRAKGNDLVDHRGMLVGHGDLGGSHHDLCDRRRVNMIRGRSCDRSLAAGCQRT